MEGTALSAVKGRQSAPRLLQAFAWLDESPVTWLGALAGLAAFVLPLVAYLLTCMREPGHFTDYIEMAMVGKVWGIPHPPGFPLYIVLSGLVSMIPTGSLTFRVAMISAFSVAVVSHLIYRIARLLNFGHVLAFCTALLVASSYPVWMQGIITDCYGLGMLLLFATLWTLFKWGLTSDDRWIHAAIWTFMLGLANHPSGIVVLPGFLAFVFARNPRVLVKTSTLLNLGSAVAAALGFYSYIYWRSFAQPVYNEYLLDGDFRKFIDFVTAKDFRILVGAKPDHISRMWSTFVGMGIDSLTKPGWYAAWIGIWASIERNRAFAVTLFLAPAGILAYVYYYHTAEIESRLAPIYPFAVLLAVALCIWIVEKMRLWLRPKCNARGPRRSMAIRMGFALIAVLLAAGVTRNVALNMRTLDWSGPNPDHAAAARIFGAVEQPCVIVADQDADLALQLLFCIITDPNSAVDRFPYLSTRNRVLSTINIAGSWDRELMLEALSKGIHVYVAGRNSRLPNDPQLATSPVSTGVGTDVLFEVTPEQLT